MVVLIDNFFQENQHCFHYLDADILTWKRQFANQSLRDQNMMSNSSEDLSQLLEQMPYQFENFGNEYGDMEDGQ